ncbi:TonB-dependent receptor [Sphingomonas oligophenolica]|uniref:TonB-dependent receptor n=1 Tax=Sphingomonas oligophenolica TaxID=301154 RepID=A0ABU9YCD6_9SPHN
MGKIPARQPVRGALRYLFCTTAACAFFTTSTAAHAQSTDATAPARADSATRDDASFANDIVVTARKRAERLIDVPVAVTELDAKAIARYSSTNLAAIGTLVPGVSFERTAGGSTGASLTIRGVGNLASDYGNEQPVAVNIDGMQVTKGRVADVGYFDIQSVEVLKGPQSLFFGKNSPAGVVSINSVSPGDKLEGYVRAGYEFVSREPVVEGAISVPLTDTLAMRIAGRYSNMTHGYIVNTARSIPDPFDAGNLTLPGAAYDRGPNSRTTAGRFTLKWKPSADFDATLKVLGSSYRDRGGALEEIFTCGANSRPTTYNLLNPAQALQDPFGDCVANRKVSFGQAPPEIVSKFIGAPADGKPYSSTGVVMSSLVMNYKISDITLSSVTGYYHQNQAGYDQYDGSVYGQAINVQHDYDTQIAQELRATSSFAGPLNFTLGAYFEHDNHRVTNSDKIFALGFYPGTGPYAGASNTLAMTGKVKSTNYSFFGQLSWKIMPNLELAGGARYSHDDRAGELGNIFNFFDVITTPATNPFSPAGVVYRPKLKEDNVSPEATLTWHPSRDLTLYGAFKTGYLSGGIAMPPNVSNYTTLTDPNGPFLYSQEKVHGGEIGFKGVLLGGKMRADLTLFHYVFTGLQVQTLDPQTLNYAIHNAGRARDQGVEGSINYRFSRAFSAHAALSYFDLKFVSYPGAQCYPGQTAAQGCVGGSQDLSGKAYGDGPFQFNVGVNAEVPISRAFNLAFSADVFHNTKSPIYEQDPIVFTPAYTILNMSVGLAQNDGPFELTLIGTNLTNSIYWKNFLFKPLGANDDVIAESVNPPRQVRLQATYRF